jgi:hypothetical protein
LSVSGCHSYERRDLYFDLTFISGENLKRGLINIPKARKKDKDEDNIFWRIGRNRRNRRIRRTQIDDLDIMDEVDE